MKVHYVQPKGKRVKKYMWRLTHIEKDLKLKYKFNIKTKRWVLNRSEEYYKHYEDCEWYRPTGSVKSAIRHLRKQKYLPKGLVFKLNGREIGQDVYIKM